MPLARLHRPCENYCFVHSFDSRATAASQKHHEKGREKQREKAYSAKLFASHLPAGSQVQPHSDRKQNSKQDQNSYAPIKPTWHNQLL